MQRERDRFRSGAAVGPPVDATNVVAGVDAGHEDRPPAGRPADRGRAGRPDVGGRGAGLDEERRHDEVTRKRPTIDARRR